MIKKLAILLGVAGLAALCAGLAACKKEQTELDKYDVLVYYDANGGGFQNRDDVSLADGFNFSDYEADENGNYHFKLTEPTSSSRKNKVSLTKSQSFFAGWYKTRTMIVEDDGSIKDSSGRLIKEDDGKYYVVDEEGNYLDANGKVLIKRNGEYYVINTNDKGKRVLTDPVYKYDDYWDFENDTFECSKNGVRKLTLYAGWVPYYTFEYYYQNNGQWVKYGETYFDYKTTNAENSKTYDYDTIWIPDWANGIMDHTHKYESSGTYTFPKLSGSTFIAAYSDEACTQKIESSFTHQGSLDVLHAEAIDRVQKIYVEFENVERYRIENAEQLKNNPNLNGYYTVLDDLDFSEYDWPSLFATGTFRGEFCAEDGKTVTISNAKASLDTTISYGGLFGRIANGAKISGITFTEATVTLAETRRNQTCSIGLFAGEVEEGASVSGVTVDGALVLGQVHNLSNCTVNMVVGSGSRNGVTVAGVGIKLQASGKSQIGYYSYTVDPENTTIDSDGNVTIAFLDNANSKRDNEIEDINTFGGNRNE